MKKWIVTGVSGSGRIELLEELKGYAASIGKTVAVYDVGELIRRECKRNRIKFADQFILDLDHNVLRVLRSAAVKEVQLKLKNESAADIHFIGVHATFRWKRRLIPGISYRDLADINPDGFINIVDDVREVCLANIKNPKWNRKTVPTLEETQEWMREEEFITETMAEFFDKPVFLVARKHNIKNLADLFFSAKKKVYLSYPITAVRKESPELIEQIQGPVLKKLEDLFVVFNPLTIKDMILTYIRPRVELPELVEQLTPKAKEIIKTRTIERDFQFIDQSDAIVVFYLTDKLSVGVLSEIQYAHRNQKPVYVVYKGTGGPFFEDVTTVIEKDIDSLMKRLRAFAQRGEK
jgi:adenylate kinase